VVIESLVGARDSQAGSTIKISNISPKASEKTIADFFSFCGKILNLTMRRYVSRSRRP